jgi:hypothetical protein
VDVRVHRLDRGLVRDFGVGMDRGENASREHDAYEERTAIYVANFWNPLRTLMSSSFPTCVPSGSFGIYYSGEIHVHATEAMCVHQVHPERAFALNTSSYW